MVFRTEAHGAVVCMDIFFRTLGAVVSRTGIFVATLSELGLSWLLFSRLGYQRRTMVFKTVSLVAMLCRAEVFRDPILGFIDIEL